MEGNLQLLLSNGSLVDHLNHVYGVRNVNREWLYCNRNTCRRDIPDRLCAADIRNVSNGSLPWSIHDAHSAQLGVKVFVQIENIMNAAASDPTRNGPVRLLQFTFTDGSLPFVALEVNTAGSEFSSQVIRGSKVILLPTAVVRRGRILFTADDYELVDATKSVQFRHDDGAPLLTASNKNPGVDSDKERVSPTQDSRAPAQPSGMNEKRIAELVSPSDPDQHPSRIRTGSLCADAQDSFRNCNDTPNSLGGRAVRAGLVRVQMSQHPPLVSRCAHASGIAQNKGEEAPAAIPVLPPTFDLFFREVDKADPVQQKNEMNDGLASDIVHIRGRQREECAPGVHWTEDCVPVDGSVRMNGASKASHSKRFCCATFMWLESLAGAKESQKAEKGVCRLYATKLGQVLNEQLLHRRRDALVVVDDGTAVVVVSVTRCQGRNSASCGLIRSQINVICRAICGMVQIEMQNESEANATTCLNARDEVGCRSIHGLRKPIEGPFFY